MAQEQERRERTSEEVEQSQEEVPTPPAQTPLETSGGQQVAEEDDINLDEWAAKMKGLSKNYKQKGGQ